MSLAVIAFALIAIIGVLPTGMSVQRDNREETIVNQDAHIWLDALRNGEQGLDDLTNYVTSIEISTREYFYEPSYGGPTAGPYWVYSYTYGGSSNAPGYPAYPFGAVPSYPIRNGLRIVGLLSTPKYIPATIQDAQRGGFYSNHVVAYVRSMSGGAADKVPNTSEVRGMAFSYRIISDVLATTSATAPVSSTVYYRSNNPSAFVKDLWNNSHEIRLRFDWPLLANGSVGNGHVFFRATAGGTVLTTNDLGLLKPPVPDTIYFLQPHSYAAAQ